MLSAYHHAIIFRVDLVRSFLLPLSIFSDDVQEVCIDRFGIDDARELVKKAYSRPIEAVEQILVVRTDFITLEAQNALLKVLEEPPSSTKFVFVVPKDFIILPTLSSRFGEFFSKEKNIVSETNQNIVFSEFMKNGYSERLSSIEQAIKKKDMEWQKSIKRGLIEYLEKPFEISSSLKELEYSARLLLTRGASNKMLFEHVALILPTRFE
jgi:DNA polymerase III delta prime subunit